MNRETLIKIGKDAISNSSMKSYLKSMSNIAFEIIGATGVEYYGTTAITDFTKNEANFEDIKYYKYQDYELVKCSFGSVLNTKEYISDKVIIFSVISDDERIFYITECTCDEDDDC